MAKRYPGYMLAKSGHILPSDDIKINLDELFEFFRSKDLSRYEAEKDKFFGATSRYTTGNAVEQMRLLFATYPRSGNSMMRKYFENITGTVTGTDNDVNHPPIIALQYSGFKGEGIKDNSIWITKTHFPLVFPFQTRHEYDYVVICSRYELDTDVSFYYNVYTNTHGLAFNNELTKDPIKPYWVFF